MANQLRVTLISTELAYIVFAVSGFCSTMNLDAGLRAGVFAYTAFVVFFAGRLAPLRPML